MEISRQGNAVRFRRGVTVLGLTMILLPVQAWSAPTAVQKCQASKDQAAGKYALCRLSAEKGLALTGDVAKYNAAVGKCGTKLEEAWQKADDKAVAAASACADAALDVELYQQVLDFFSSKIATATATGTLVVPVDPVTCSASQECGSIDDGCGGQVSCGDCTAPDTCGGGGTPNQCATPCTSRTCAADYPGMCGTLDDGCGGNLTCDICMSNQTCGGVTPNVCCNRRTCAANYPGQCGSMLSDGCGGTIACNTCAASQTCTGPGGAGTTTPGTCCTRRTCSADYPNQCGSALSDGCNGTLNCSSSCVAPRTCGGGGTPNVCGP